MVRISAFLGLCLLTACVPGPTDESVAFVSTQSFTPTDDAYLENGIRRNNTFLRVEHSSTSVRTIYLKFNVSGLPGSVTSARLRLTEAGGQARNGSWQIYAGSHNNWNERNLSTANAPSVGQRLDTETGPKAGNASYTFDVTDAVREGTFTFIIRMDLGAGQDPGFSSKEGNSPPTLIVDTNDCTPDCTGRSCGASDGCGGSCGSINDPGCGNELFPTDDAYIDSGARINDAKLRVENRNGRNRTSYLRFDLSNVSGVSSARLVLTESGGQARNGTWSVYLGSHNNWNERNLTTGNAPNPQRLLDTLSAQKPGNATYTWDVSSALSNTNAITFIVQMEPDAGQDPGFSSKEGDHTPRLVLSGSGSTTCDNTHCSNGVQDCGETGIDCSDQNCSSTLTTVGGEIVIEAENFTTTGGTFGLWTTQTALAGHHGGYVQSGTDNRGVQFDPNAGRLDYVIDFQQAGTYYVHLRTHAVDHMENGFYAMLDGRPINYGGVHPVTGHEADFIYVNKSGRWSWYTDGGGAEGRNLRVSFSATAGEHTFSIYRRDAGSKIDRIWLTKHTSAPQSTPQSDPSSFVGNGSCAPAVCGPCGNSNNGPILSGTRRVWQTVTIDFAGPRHSELDSSPNPFLDYRYEVNFTSPSNRQITVPGYFDGNGNGGGTGNIWRARFTPDEAGTWRYTVSFKSGNNAAIYNTGSPTAFHGHSGSLSIAARQASAPGFSSKGRLVYDGTFYLKTLGDNRHFIKAGTDSPENFLGYDGFDNTFANPTPKTRYRFHQFASHVRDWNSGDPDWNNGAGRGIIGSINYLAEQKVNSLYALLMNIGGDGNDVHPFAGPIDPTGINNNNNRWYDLSKLHQWETVFAHAQKKGIHLQLLFGEGERENKSELDNGGALGVERRLFYREMIARFGHHNAITWNICEEYDHGAFPTPDQIKSYAQFLRNTDPYRHPITVHQGKEDAWDPFFGDNRFDAVSYQWSQDEGAKVEELRRATRAAGRILPINMDETKSTGIANNESLIVIDNGNWQRYVHGQIAIRKLVIYPVFFSGGNTELITDEVLGTENFRGYEPVWRYMYHARSFLEDLPFWQMEPRDQLLSGEAGNDGEVFAKAGEVYAIYLPDASPSGSINLPRGAYQKRWYNPRNGQFQGGTSTVNGGGNRALGSPPHTANEDWVLLLEAQ